MTKEEKREFVVKLTEKFKQNPNFFILDIGGFTVEKTFAFRKKLYKEKLELKTAKNTLIKKSLEQIGNYSELFPALEYSSTIVFIKDNPNMPANLIKEFRDKDEKPIVKAAYYESTAFVGDNTLDVMITLKSKAQLLGEIVGMLQGPITNVISALKSSGDTIGGLLKAIEEKKQ